MTTERYLLDTSVMLLLVRGGEPGRAIIEKFGLSTAAKRPLVSIVTHAELQVLARRNGWGLAKRQALAGALANVVTINVRSGPLLEAYNSVELASQEHRPGARAPGQNDLWIAATAKVAGATLLTTDKDFTHLSADHCRVVVIETRTLLHKEEPHGQDEEAEARSRVGGRSGGDAGLRHG